MNRQWPHLLRWLGSTRAVTARGLRNAIIAVLFVPVLPDIAVESFGADEPGWLNPVLRVAALGVVVAAMVAFHRLQLGLAKRRAAQAVVHRMRTYSAVVLPMSSSSKYRGTASRGRDPSVPEVIVAQARPILVVAVTTDQVTDDVIDTMRTELRADGIELETVHLTEPGDVTVTVPEATTRVHEVLRRRGVTARDVCFDTTGGTVPMSLAMLHAAARYGSECCYVSSGFRNGARLPGSQTVAAFDPADLAAGP